MKLSTRKGKKKTTNEKKNKYVNLGVEKWKYIMLKKEIFDLQC